MAASIREGLSKKSLVFVCYHTVPEWWDGHLPGGTAGSEEAVVEMARCFAKRGWDVQVYNNCGSGPRDVNGVRYIPRAEYEYAAAVDVTVVWRTPRLLDYAINSKKTYLWLHDDVPEQELTAQRLAKITKVISLSTFQRCLWPHIPNNKILLSANGIDTERTHSVRLSGVEASIQKNPRKCIYASAPERGLECLLRLWPDIYGQVPSATLSIFYGWELWDYFYSRSAEKINWKESIISLMNQPGIVVKCEHIKMDRLWDEYLSSSIWVYPTEWKENSCITAMKAQACGVLPVTTSVAALAETVQWGRKINATNIYTNAAAQHELVNAVVDYLMGPDELYRRQMVDWAKSMFSWEKVGYQWEQDFDVPV
jgi:glycosyltransferase involved in cell wall biosynthesis